MKIAFFSIRDWDCGGVTNYILNLYHALNNIGHKADIFVITRSGRPLKAYYQNCKTVRYFSHKDPEENARILKKYDIIHLTDMGRYEDKKDTPIYWPTLHLLQKFKHKIIGTWHCSPAYTQKRFFPDSFALNDIFCQVSYCVRKREGMIHLPHLINCSILSKTTMHHKENLAISTARVTSSKRQINILKAVPRIKGKVIIYSWTRGRSTYDMEKMKEFKHKNLFTCPAYTYEQIPRMMKNAKVLLNLSHYDGTEQGTEYCVLEAMLHGLVPIVDKSWVSGNSILVDTVNVMAIDSKNEKAIANAVNMIFKNEKLRTHIVMNNFQFVRKFDSKVVVKKYVKFYNWVLKGRKAR